MSATVIVRRCLYDAEAVPVEDAVCLDQAFLEASDHRRRHVRIVSVMSGEFIWGWFPSREWRTATDPESIPSG